MTFLEFACPTWSFVFRTYEIEEICDFKICFIFDSIAEKLTKKQCCGSGILSRIQDPEFYPFRISDPGSRISDPGFRIQKQQKKRGVKKKLL
jgi:hypothetical protein